MAVLNDQSYVVIDSKIQHISHVFKLSLSTKFLNQFHHKQCNSLQLMRTCDLVKILVPLQSLDRNAAQLQKCLAIYTSQIKVLTVNNGRVGFFKIYEYCTRYDPEDEVTILLINIK